MRFFCVCCSPQCLVCICHFYFDILKRFEAWTLLFPLFLFISCAISLYSLFLYLKESFLYEASNGCVVFRSEWLLFFFSALRAHINSKFDAVAMTDAERFVCFAALTRATFITHLPNNNRPKNAFTDKIWCCTVCKRHIKGIYNIQFFEEEKKPDITSDWIAKAANISLKEIQKWDAKSTRAKTR